MDPFPAFLQFSHSAVRRIIKSLKLTTGEQYLKDQFLVPELNLCDRSYTLKLDFSYGLAPPAHPEADFREMSVSMRQRGQFETARIVLGIPFCATLCSGDDGFPEVKVEHASEVTVSYPLKKDGKKLLFDPADIAKDEIRFVAPAISKLTPVLNAYLNGYHFGRERTLSRGPWTGSMLLPARGSESGENRPTKVSYRIEADQPFQITGLDVANRTVSVLFDLSFMFSFLPPDARPTAEGRFKVVIAIPYEEELEFLGSEGEQECFRTWTLRPSQITEGSLRFVEDSFDEPTREVLGFLAGCFGVRADLSDLNNPALRKLIGFDLPFIQPQRWGDVTFTFRDVDDRLIRRAVWDCFSGVEPIVLFDFSSVDFVEKLSAWIVDNTSITLAFNGQDRDVRTLQNQLAGDLDFVYFVRSDIVKPGLTKAAEDFRREFNQTIGDVHVHHLGLSLGEQKLVVSGDGDVHVGEVSLGDVELDFVPDPEFSVSGHIDVAGVDLGGLIQFGSPEVHLTRTDFLSLFLSLFSAVFSQTTGISMVLSRTIWVLHAAESESADTVSIEAKITGSAESTVPLKLVFSQVAMTSTGIAFRGFLSLSSDNCPLGCFAVSRVQPSRKGIVAVLLDNHKGVQWPLRRRDAIRLVENGLFSLEGVTIVEGTTGKYLRAEANASEEDNLANRDRFRL